MTDMPEKNREFIVCLKGWSRNNNIQACSGEAKARCVGGGATQRIIMEL